MKEYRVMAYFQDDAPRGNQPRSFRRKIVNTPEDAKLLWEDAMMYYENYRYIEKVVIESRDVDEWKLCQ